MTIPSSTTKCSTLEHYVAFVANENYSSFARGKKKFVPVNSEGPD